MKYTLTYKNKQGVEARLDIITHDDYSITEIIEGTDTPFILNYKREKNDKEGYIISSSADIAIYESGTFNIDTLKTSSETDIKVEYYIDNVLTWSGFVVPDFFSRVIGTPAVVNMVASDRLGSLKGQTLSNLPATITLSSLVSSCLAKTGLSLPVNLKADFTSVAGNENVFASKVISQRFTDTKGRNISCYDILRSILVMTNSVVVQRNGEWYVVNKFQVEQEMVLPEQQYIDFNKVTVGARRQIVPVASSVGVYHEFGGGRRHPSNFDFSEGISGWNEKSGFTSTINNLNIIGFEFVGNHYEPVFGTEQGNNYLLFRHQYQYPEFSAYLESNPITIYSGDVYKAELSVNINLTTTNDSGANIVVIATNGNKTLYLNSAGAFQSDFTALRAINFKRDAPYTEALTGSFTFNGVLNVSGEDGDRIDDYVIKLRVYGSSVTRVNTVVVNFFYVSFERNNNIPKGNIYKTIQGNNFTKVHDTDTSIIGDYLTSGLNGYFYPYPIDDTSSLLTSSGNLTTRWTVPYSDEELPLLQHIARQRSRMFSVAHDLLSAEIDSDILDPLAIFRDCSGKKYVMVSGSQDFLRGTINVEIEEIAYDLEIWKRDYIYSYFGEGEEGISSVGGISELAPPSAGGGGMTPEQLEILNNLSSWWKLDEENDAIYSDLSVYSKKEISAYGVGSGTGGGGGTGYERLDAWSDYTSDKAGWVLSALLGNDLNTRVSNIEANSALNISLTGAGNAITSVSKSGNTLTFTKGSTFSLSTHNHDTVYKPIGYVPSWSEITGKPSTFTPSSHTHTIANVTGLQSALDGKEPSFTKNTAFNKNFGTTAGTVAQGNDSRIINGQTAYNWGNHASAGYYNILNNTGYLTGYIDLNNVPAGVRGLAQLTVDNIPATGFNDVTTISQYGSNDLLQIVYPFRGDGKFYMRNKSSVTEQWSNWLKIWHSGNLTSLSQLTDNIGVATHIANKANPHAVTTAQIGAVDLTTNQTITGAKTFSTLLTARAGVNTPKIDFGNGFTVEPSGTELVFKYNGVIKQRMLSDGSIVATGELTAYVAAT
jgi:hypothetical protein